MAKEYGTTCRILVMPRNELEEGTAGFYFRATESRIDTTAVIEYQNNLLVIRGMGFDGRCSFCRYFRMALKRQNIQCKVNCPFEVITPGTADECKVAIGERFFDQSYLENEENLKKYLDEVKQNQGNKEAYLALGVIYEYHGRFVDSISAYWRAYELDNQDLFARARLKEILEFLIEIVPDP